MNSLNMTDAKAKKMSEIEDMSLDTIKKALDGKLSADSDEVKVAVKMMGVVAKNRQTLTNRSAIEFGMAQIIATEAGLKKYVEITSPQIKKAIAGKVLKRFDNRPAAGGE